MESELVSPTRRHSEIGTRKMLFRRAVRTMTVALGTAGVVCTAAIAAAPLAHAADATPNLVEITSRYSGNPLRLDVMWASTEAGAGVFLWPDNSSASQEFEKIDGGGGYFRLKARHSGQCLRTDWRDGTVLNGTPVIQWWSCSEGYSPAEWSTVYIRDTLSAPNTFQATKMLMKNRASGLCLDARNVSAGPPPERAVLQVRDCVTADTDPNVRNQLWSLTFATSQPPHIP